MTAERIKEIGQMLEAWRETDANQLDAEKTSVVEELLVTAINRADCGVSNAASAD